MFTCGPAFFKVQGSVLPPAPTTQTMDYTLHGKPFVVIAMGGIVTNTLDYQLKAQPFFVQ